MRFRLGDRYGDGDSSDTLALGKQYIHDRPLAGQLAHALWVSMRPGPLAQVLGERIGKQEGKYLSRPTEYALNNT